MLPSQLFAVADNEAEYNVPYSVRFRSSSPAYLSKTYSSAIVPTGNGKTWTWSSWVKRSTIGGNDYIFNCGAAASYDQGLYINSNNQLVFAVYNGVVSVVASPLFRDPSAWYHIQLVHDSTNTIASERLRMYINGSRVVSFTAAIYPALNAVNKCFNDATTYIGRFYANTTNNFEGYLAEINFVDGQALDPIEFGEISLISGEWVPVRYTGTYGQNGFYLNFDDASSLTAIAEDHSGQNNHWTASGVSLTADYTYDSMLDTPTNNHATYNYVDYQALGVLYNGGLRSVTPSGSGGIAWSTMSVDKGKWFVEFKPQPGSNADIGIIAAVTRIRSNQLVTNIGAYTNGYSYIGSGTKYHAGIATAYGDPYATGDVVGVALDLDVGTIEFYNNGVGQGIAFTGIVGRYVFGIGYDGAAGGYICNVNFGQQPYDYTPPAGFNSLCAKNLPMPAIKRGELGMDIVTYTGNGANLQVGEYQFPRPDYLIERSLRFKGINSYLNRTPAIAGDRTKWTWSGWVKRSGMDTLQTMFECYGDNSTIPRDLLYFNVDNYLAFWVSGYNSASFIGKLSTTIIFKNTSIWQHITAIYDSGNVTASERMRLYINGNRITSFTTEVYPTLNATSQTNSAQIHRIGVDPFALGIWYFQGYMAEINFIDGQALDASNFGTWDVSGYWVPKAYVGTYGTNGFYLNFSDTTSVAALGYDQSGGTNNWAVNNISLTADATYDSMLDTPTNSHAILSQHQVRRTTTQTDGVHGWGVLDSGLLRAYTNNISMTMYDLAIKIPTSGKYYFEITYKGVYLSYPLLNINNLSDPVDSYGRRLPANGVLAIGGTANATKCVMIDFDNEVFYVGTNSVSSTPVAFNRPIKYNDFFEIQLHSYANGGFPTAEASFNFGQQPFIYTPPEGFKSLSIPNIAEYTQDLESPDLVWIKCRSAAQNHMLFDSARGASKYLSTNLTAAEVTDVNSLISFNRNGFYLGNNANVNALNATYVAWMWKASQSPVTNNNGTITSEVRANPELGFSIVKYTGNSSNNETVGHGLGVAPNLIIIKDIDTVKDWPVYHSDLGATKGLYLNQTTAAATTIDLWYNTEPDSLVFHIDYTANSTVNGVGQHIAYCWTEIPGFSLFSSYIGNGNANGPFVPCGFAPRWVMIRRTDAASDWWVFDTERDSVNVTDGYLLPNLTTIETGTVNIDMLSNGFKIRSATIANVAGATYIYAAFAESPHKYSNGR